MVVRTFVRSAFLSVALALVLVPVAAAATSTQHKPSAGHLPSRGVLIPGKSLGGVSLGQTQTKVKALWGGRFTQCEKSFCKDPTWLYFYATGEPLGAATRFRDNKVVAVFTLGATTGWKTSNGLKIADPASRVYELYGSPRYTKCIGYEALSVTQGRVVTSFYLTSGVIYGFALTVPGLTVCQ
jgi:hypothetical protein